MRLKGKLLAAATIAAASLALPAQAQYVGPTDGPGVKISTILQEPKDDQDVVLRGHIVRKTGHEKYIFSDGTGEITVEIDDDDFPVEAVDAKTLVELRGEVDTGRDRPPEIEVDSVSIVK